MPKAIIVGCASGIGKEVAGILINEGYELALADYRIDLLQEFSNQFPQKVFIKKIDVALQSEARELVNELIEALGGVDVFIYCAGVKVQSSLWRDEYNLHQVNAVGFAALASLVFQYFRDKNQPGHIVGISSLLAMRGFENAIAYCASKAFMRTYMQGLQHKSAVRNLGITVTDIRPGFVNTSMLENRKGLFWVSTVKKAAAEIVQGY